MADPSNMRDVVRRALRSMGGLTQGAQPTGADAADGLERAQSAILNLPGFINGGQWCERAISAAYTACEGQRITVTAPGSVTLPITITYEACNRKPRDFAKVQIIGDTDNAGIWLYSATKGRWVQADALTLDSEVPFGEEHVAGLAAQLAVSWVDEYGGELSASTVGQAQQSARTMRALFKKNRPGDRSWDVFAPCNGPFWDYV